MIGGGQGSFGSAHAATVQSKALEGLRTRHLVDEVQIDVEERLFAGRLDGVLVPDLLEEGPGRHLANPHDGESQNPGRRLVFNVVTHGVTEQRAAQR